MSGRGAKRRRTTRSAAKDTNSAKSSTSQDHIKGTGSGSEQSGSKPEYVTKQDLDRALKKLLQKKSKQDSRSSSDSDQASDTSSQDTDTDCEIEFKGKSAFKSRINAHLKPSQKEKIWAFQYVKLHSILPPSYTSQDDVF